MEARTRVGKEKERLIQREKDRERGRLIEKERDREKQI